MRDMAKCECGCGEETTVYRGVPRRFILGHNTSDKNIGNNFGLGYRHTTKTLKKISGENHPNWQGGISSAPYCYKFNNRFKEMVRDKFSRLCFLCGKSETDNNAKLSVHHIDYNKMQGCDGTICECVPLCMSCHSKIHNGHKEEYETLLITKLEGLT